eukprot:COSAG05_NODE_12015_length_487_cov_0.572165_1_plen_101_part_10
MVAVVPSSTLPDFLPASDSFAPHQQQFHEQQQLLPPRQHHQGRGALPMRPHNEQKQQCGGVGKPQTTGGDGGDEVYWDQLDTAAAGVVWSGSPSQPEGQYH